MFDRYKHFTVLITRINRCIKRIKTDEMEEFNLKSPHVSVLYYLHNEGELTAKELTNICDEDKAAVSRSIEYLEKNGYVICQSLTKKRYKSLLSLTEKGKKVGKCICEKVNKVLDKASLGVDEENRKNMYKSLDLIARNLENINDI